MFGGKTKIGKGWTKTACINRDKKKGRTNGGIITSVKIIFTLENATVEKRIFRKDESF